MGGERIRDGSVLCGLLVPIVLAQVALRAAIAGSSEVSGDFACVGTS